MNFPSFARASLSGTLRGRGQLNSLGSFLLREPQVLLTVALIVLTGILNPRFLTTRNLINVLRQSSINGIVTVGVCWMMISGSFDLSRRCDRVADQCDDGRHARGRQWDRDHHHLRPGNWTGNRHIQRFSGWQVESESHANHPGHDDDLPGESPCLAPAAITTEFLETVHSF